MGAGELPHRLLQRLQGGLADRGGLQRPGQPRLGLGRQLQAGRLVAEQLRSGPPEGPGEQVAVEGAGLLVVVDPRLTMASRLSVPGRVSPLPAAWLRPPQQPSRGTGTP
jgi:hypothetical protein